MTDATAGAQGAPRVYAGVMSECRNLLRERLRSAMASARIKLGEELFQHEAQGTGTGPQHPLHELGDLDRADNDELERAFSSAYDHGFRTRARKYSSTTTSLYRTDTEGTMELSLVDDQSFAESLIVKNVANLFEGACDDELKDLRARVALMMGVADLDRSTNPFGTEAVSEALKHACWSLTCPQPAKVQLFEFVARALLPALKAAYHDINAHLVARNVLPRVRHAVRHGGALRGKKRHPHPHDSSEGTTDTLRQLFTPRDEREESAGEGGTLIPVDAAVLSMLTQLQQGASDGFLGGERFSIDHDAAATVNLLHGLLEAGLGKHVGSVDGIVIDVVATLFDFIFEDERVPDTMKGLIGRLQLPVLKQALVDRSFFANRLHPARRLISALAHAATTWDGEFSVDSSLYRAAEPLVVRIQNEAGEDDDVFATCLAALEAFLTEQELRADEKAALLTSRLEQRERLEIARSIGESAIAPHLAAPDLPDPIRVFLGGPWLSVLVAAIERGGEDGKPWLEAIETMDELIWSVRPKQGAEERQRLVKLLPGLLRSLRAGLDATTVGTEVRDAFFAELVKLHAAAVKSGMSGQSASTGPTATTTASVDGTPRPVEAGAPPPAQLDALERGRWIELHIEESGARAVRLTWVSPARTMYLFANRQGQRALALTRAELARKFVSGEAQLLDDEPYMDKIVAEVLDEYQQPEA